MTQAKGQVGLNARERVVKIRLQDEDGSWIVQPMSPDEARGLAARLDNGLRRLRASNGIRWTEHDLPDATAKDFAKQLRECAAQIEN